MRCETSFFSLTLFKKYLQRYWPLWAVWLAGWLMAMPVNLWNEAAWGGARSLVQRYDDALTVTSGIIAVMAPIVAVCVFFYLFKAPAANFIGALPLRREGVFATAALAGYVMLTLPILLTGFVTVLVEWAVGVVAPGPLLTLMGGCLLQSFFWFSFATLCYVISGNAIAGVSFYIIFNGVIITMVWLVQNVLSAFLYGFSQFGEGVWEAAAWLTPIFKTSLNDDIIGQGLTPVSRADMLWVYAAVGFLMLLAALGLHHIRKAERAGDLIAFGPIRWLFRIDVTLCGGLSLGLLLLVLLFDGRVTKDMGMALAGCCAVAAVISWFAAEMLLQKSFKVFKSHWKGAAVGALCFVVAICAIDMDWIGFTTRVPKAAQVKTATVTFGGGDIDPIARDGLTYDGQTVADILALHQYVVENKEDLQENYGRGNRYGRLELEYDLGLTKLRREYSFYYDQESQMDSLLTAAQASGLPQLDVDRGDPMGGYLDTRTEGKDEREYYDLDAQQAQRVWAAILEDYQAGRYRPDGTDYLGDVELRWEVKGVGRTEYKWFYPRAGTTSLNAVLAEICAEVEPDEWELNPEAGVPATEVLFSGETMPPMDEEPPLGGGEEIVD